MSLELCPPCVRCIFNIRNKIEFRVKKMLRFLTQEEGLKCCRSGKIMDSISVSSIYHPLMIIHCTGFSLQVSESGYLKAIAFSSSKEENKKNAESRP